MQRELVIVSFSFLSPCGPVIPDFRRISQRHLLWLWPQYRPELGWCTEKLSKATSLMGLSLQMWQSAAFCVFSNLQASSLATFSSPGMPASSFLLPGRFQARRLQRVPFCIEPAPKVSVASDDFVSETAWLMHLCFYCEASVFRRFAAFQTLEVGVYHVRRFHLLVKVFESQLVISTLGQLCSC